MSPAKACEDQPGGEVDAVAVGPVRRAAAGNVEHAGDAPGLVDAHYVSSGKHKMLSKLAPQSFNILRLIARNPNFLRPKVPYFNVSRLSTLFPISN